MDVAEIVRSSSTYNGSSFRSGSERDSVKETDDEVELQWAAIEKLPTIKRLRTSLFDSEYDGASEGQKNHTMTDLSKLGALERQLIVDKLINHVEEDNRRLLLKMREHMDR